MLIYYKMFEDWMTQLLHEESFFFDYKRRQIRAAKRRANFKKSRYANPSNDSILFRAMDRAVMNYEKDCYVGPNVIIRPGSMVGVGCRFTGHSTIGFGCLLLGYITVGTWTSIGDGCRIGSNVWIGAGNTINAAQIGFDTIIADNCHIGHNVTIGDNVYIGKNVRIMPGCTIDDDAVIGNDCVIDYRCDIGPVVVEHGTVFKSGTVAEVK